MSRPLKQSLIAITIAGLLVANVADAARLGGGRSSGMKRSAPTQSYSPAPVAQPQSVRPTPQPQAAAPARSGPGIGTAVAAGVAGAAAGYMLSEAMKDKPAVAGAPASVAAPSAAPASAYTAPAQAYPAYGGAPAHSQGGMPWGWLLLLGGLTVAGFMFMKRKMAAQAGGLAGSAPQRPAPATGQVYRVAGGDAAAPMTTGGVGGGATGLVGNRLPDGTELPAFLRQAKASFLHLQTMNSPDQIESLRAYLTPQLFDEISADIKANQEPADFPRLELALIETAEENGDYIASVRFSGEVSESLSSAPAPFTEVWHFVKAKSEPLKWKVAGIQQA